MVKLSRLFLLALTIGGTILLSGCGRVGDPLPPIRHRALVPEMLRVAQRGDALILTWPKPGPVAIQDSKIIRAEILRREEKADEPARLPEEKFLEEARIIGSLSLREITDTEATSLHFSDPLPASTNVNADLRYRYAIRYVRFADTPMPLSNYALLEPVTRIARPPAAINGEVTQDIIKLSWSAPTSNLDDSQPALVVGYNIYRHRKDQPASDQPINSQPINGTNFEDRDFKFGNEYIYTVRTLSQGKENSIEGPDSPETRVMALDTFAPAKPTNVTAAAAGGVVSIFWPSNSERDLKGYLIYRAEQSEAPRTEWQKLTPAPIAATTFRDERAQAGKIYYYFITAIDRAGNESEPSQKVEVEVFQ